ncbi:MAG: hypothetical protein IJ575_03410 [Selenomonadaceae bacterium]|nr:hypothetical protein [Selenomonadaceae bacterium]
MKKLVSILTLILMLGIFQTASAEEDTVYISDLKFQSLFKKIQHGKSTRSMYPIVPIFFTDCISSKPLQNGLTPWVCGFGTTDHKEDLLGMIGFLVDDKNRVTSISIKPNPETDREVIFTSTMIVLECLELNQSEIEFLIAQKESNKAVWCKNSNRAILLSEQENSKMIIASRDEKLKKLLQILKK